MSVDKIMTISSPVSPLGKSYPKADQATSESSTTTTTNKAPVNTVQKDSVTLSSAASKEVGTSSQDRGNELSQVIRSVKEALATLGIAAGHVGGMKAALEAIVKNFPPFPHDSEERAQILRGYSSLRKQIEQMTIPPSFSEILDAVRDLSDKASDEEVGAALETVNSVQSQIGQVQARYPGTSDDTSRYGAEGIDGIVPDWQQRI